MPKQIFSCPRCAQPFTPRPNNRHRQQFCSRKSCQRRRWREYQRKWHRARYAEDAAFRAAAKARVKRCRQRQKNAPAVVPAAASVSEARLERVSLAVLGLAVQFGEDDDPGRAAALVTAWADHGARLGSGLASGP